MALKPYSFFPLAVVSSYDNIDWGGRSNFGSEVTVTSIQNAVLWIEEWGDPYFFLFDGENNTVYISLEEVRERAIKSCLRNYTDIEPTVIVASLPELIVKFQPTSADIF